MSVEETVHDEIANDRPRRPPFLLSRTEKDTVIARAVHSLYRWYTSKSQERRNWHPDRSFDWKAIRPNHSSELMSIIEGYFAVEQYAPDYTSRLVELVRKQYGRSQFQMRWGAEEEKHADLWRNVLLFSRARSSHELEEYTAVLRENAWEMPWECHLRMLLYTVFQEKATQLIYLNTARIVRGEHPKACFANDVDPVLEAAINVIALDEAAHFDFFIEVARLYLYYYPEETLTCLVDVLRSFVMPASKIVPNYDAFIEELHEASIFGPSKYGREVAMPALKALGIESIKTIENGICRSKESPTFDGEVRQLDWLSGCNFAVLESSVKALFDRIRRYEDQIGLSNIAPTILVANEWPNNGARSS